MTKTKLYRITRTDGYTDYRVTDEDTAAFLHCADQPGDLVEEINETAEVTEIVDFVLWDS